jgi:hypothetical protein
MIDSYVTYKVAFKGFTTLRQFKRTLVFLPILDIVPIGFLVIFWVRLFLMMSNRADESGHYCWTSGNYNLTLTACPVETTPEDMYIYLVMKLADSLM